MTDAAALTQLLIDAELFLRIGAHFAPDKVVGDQNKATDEVLKTEGLSKTMHRLADKVRLEINRRSIYYPSSPQRREAAQMPEPGDSLIALKALYIFVARLDDDPLIDTRLQQHAHELRNELRGQHLQLNPDGWLPRSEHQARQE